MKVCTFFGHRDAPAGIRRSIEDAIIYLIEEKGVGRFYLGDSGSFDRMALGILSDIKKQYQHISYTVVLSRVPTGKIQSYNCDTVVPEGMEKAHPKYAIIYRNMWMLSLSDYVITYVRRSYGGAYRFEELAKRKNKTVIEL